MSPLRWARESTRTLATALRERGYQVSEFVVRRLLKSLGYSPQANVKTAEGRQHPDRDAQFGHLNDQVTAHPGYPRRPGDHRLPLVAGG